MPFNKITSARPIAIKMVRAKVARTACPKFVVPVAGMRKTPAQVIKDVLGKFWIMVELGGWHARHGRGRSDT